MKVKIEKNEVNEYISVNNLILTSPYSIDDEDGRFLKKIDYSLRNTVVIIYGLGIGKYVNTLEKSLHHSNTVIIVEPYSEIISHYEKSPYQVMSKRIYLINADGDDVIKFLNDNKLNTRYKTVYSYMNYRNILDQKYKVFIEKLRNDSIKRYSNELTLKKYDQEFTKNIFSNYFLHEFHLPVNALKNKYNRIPALIISAGPSLEKHLDCINMFQGLVFSGGRTIKEFLQRNIRMDFMVSVDPTDKVYELVEGSDSIGIMPPLFTYLESNLKVVKNHNNTRILMKSPSIPISMNNEFDLDIIMSGPSVSNVAVSIADYLGCNPIILIGQDLSYTDGKHHANITIKDFDKDIESNNLLIEVEGYYGEKIKTTASFYSMLSSFENWITISDKEFINSTEGGVYINGCKHVPFKDYLSNQNLDCNDSLHDLFNVISDDQPIYKKKIETYIYIEKIARLSKILKKCIYYSKKINEAVSNNIGDVKHQLKQLNILDQQIRGEMENDHMLNYLFSSAHLDFENEKRRYSKNDTLSIAKSNLQFYQSLNDNINELNNWLEENADAKSS
jgi:hypothetical protein